MASTSVAHYILNSVLTALAKGKQLVEAALLWESPIAGGSGSETDQLRGIQWRLVMAWGGLETIVKASRGKPVRGVHRRHLLDLTNNCLEDEYEPWSKTPANKKLTRWINTEWHDGDMAVLVYFGLTHPEVKQAISDWLVESRSLESWTDALQLAKAVRHASAHGYLSASKIREWGLRRSFLRLTHDIGAITSAVFRRLSE